MSRIVTFIMLLSTPAFGSVAIFPTEGVNLSAEEILALAYALGQAYERESGQEVLAARESKEVLDATGDAASAAEQLGAEEYIVMEAVALSSGIKLSDDAVKGTGKILLHAQRHKADGTLIHRASMTAYSMDDMEEVAERLAAALVAQKDVEEVRTLTTVTEKEATPLKRVATQKYKGFSTGLWVGVAKGIKIDPSISLSFSRTWDALRYYLQIGGIIIFPTRDSGNAALFGAGAEVSGGYYFTQTNISPYIGGGLMPRLTSLEADASFGLLPFADFGLTFFRESSTHLRVNARVAQNVVPVDRGGFFGFGSSDKHYPTEFALTVGVDW